MIKTTKAICVMLFGLAIMISILGFMPANDVTKGCIATLAIFIVPVGLLICFIGLIMALRAKENQ